MLIVDKSRSGGHSPDVIKEIFASGPTILNGFGPTQFLSYPQTQRLTANNPCGDTNHPN